MFLQQLSKIYGLDPSAIDSKPLKAHLQSRKREDANYNIEELDQMPIQISTCFIDILMESVCVSRDGEEVLVDGYIDFLVLICKFG